MMRKEYNSRACMILYNILKSNALEGIVIMPSNICESVPATYMKCGMKIAFCDINPVDWQIDRDYVREMLRHKKISVLHYNHTYGFISDEDTAFLREIKDQYPQILVIDDRCLCFPEDEDRSNPADVILYSTGNVKCVDIGWGGYCFMENHLKYNPYRLYYSCKDEALFDLHIKECHRNNSHVEESIVLSNWLNSDDKFDCYFEKVEQEYKKVIEHKKTIDSIYREIPGSMDVGYCKWRYQVLLENSKECIKALFDAGLFCSYHYKSLGNGYFSDIVTPNNNWLENHVINLFNDFRYTEEQALKTAEILKDIGKPTISF